MLSQYILGYCILFLFLFLPGFAHPLKYLAEALDTNTLAEVGLELAV